MENTSKRTFKDWALIALKGMGMGAADVVPGVSGGTIAFITGIYEELISSLSNINLQALQLLFKSGIGAFWKHINGNFFLSLFLGIGVSIFSLAKLLTHLLEHFPILLWSFFFGLVIASAWVIAKTIDKWRIFEILAIIAGTMLAAWISTTQTTIDGSSNAYLFMSGAIAICAMILPGISGAFILVLLGTYGVVLTAIKNVEIQTILIFGLGCIVGLLSFSKLLKFLFENFKHVVLALLTGFLIGSLFKIWPWKERVSDIPIIVHSDGREEFLLQNVLPSAFTMMDFFLPVLLVLTGFSVVYFMSKIKIEQK
jgi:putative membrane protein